MTRRRFLALVTMLFGAAFGPRENAVAGGRPSIAPAEAKALSLAAAIAGELRAHYPYLRFAEGTVDRFAERHAQLYPSTVLASQIVRMRLHGQFLMSTDFFQNGADESRELQFVAIYDPYATPCYNPFV